MYLYFSSFLDKMKFQSLAKLCSQCEEYYAETVKLMEREPIMLSLDKDWVQHVSIIDLFINILNISINLNFIGLRKTCYI